MQRRHQNDEQIAILVPTCKSFHRIKRGLNIEVLILKNEHFNNTMQKKKVGKHNKNQNFVGSAHSNCLWDGK